jgi:hypothetical protein
VGVWACGRVGVRGGLAVCGVAWRRSYSAMKPASQMKLEAGPTRRYADPFLPPPADTFHFSRKTLMAVKKSIAR